MKHWLRVSESLLLNSVSPPPQSEQSVCCILGYKKCAEKWETVLCLVLDEGATFIFPPSTCWFAQISLLLFFPPPPSFQFWTYCRECVFPCLIRLASGIIFSLFLLWYFQDLLRMAFVPLQIIKVVSYIETHVAVGRIGEKVIILCHIHPLLCNHNRRSLFVHIWMSFIINHVFIFTMMYRKRKDYVRDVSYGRDMDDQGTDHAIFFMWSSLGTKMKYKNGSIYSEHLGCNTIFDQSSSLKNNEEVLH